METRLVHQGLTRHGLARRSALAALAAGSLTGGCTLPGLGPPPPPVPREFRAAWVASVAHIDWPSRPGLAASEQREEMHARLDLAQRVGLNALVLQVRPAADALYPSDLEPWSEFLTGACGRPPDAAWDPLAEWIAGAHARGLDLHAWFNPYRARHMAARSESCAAHVVRAEPAIVRRWGEQLWMDPGEPRAAERLLAVVRDVLQRYDVDGVHIDDYFYPYPIVDAQGAEPPFPDEESWARYGDGGDRDAWRRRNVDRLVQALQREVHAVKPWVRFGISPFGLPRPDRRPPGIEGFSQYHRLHADVEHWLEQGWLDVLAPQLYWPIAKPPQAFGVLQQAWRKANLRHRHLWPGLFTSRLGAARNAYDAAEVLAQLALTREDAGLDPGHLHFSLRAILEDRDGIASRLRDGPYAEAVLTPATPWLDEAPPQPPELDRLGSRPQHSVGPPLRHAVLWQRRGTRWQWQSSALAAAQPFALDSGADARWLVGIGRSGLESAPLAV